MEVKITILSDNMAAPVSFNAEHGLAVLAEVEGKSFLWDCGQSDVALHNALILGLDLRKLEGIGISHGHYDHAGGLPTILAASGPKKVYMHPKALEPKFFIHGKVKRFIGIPFNRDALESAGARIELSDRPIEVMPGVRMTGEISRLSEFEGTEADLYCLIDGDVQQDTFPDDRSLVIDTPEGAIVLTGCAHSGLVNILEHVRETSGKIKAVIGGTHLGLGATAQRINASIDYLEEILPEKIVPCHCTGMSATMLMIQRLKDKVIPGHAGMTMSL